jgi:Monogalactosyldiacylglycerol (MGDG) synthase
VRSSSQVSESSNTLSRLGAQRSHAKHDQDQPSAARLNRVLVLSASAGAGHVRAAQALERALVATGRVGEVRHVDILQYTSKLFRRVYAQAYLDLVNRAPEVLGWLYDYFDEPWKHERVRLALDRLNTTRFVRLLKRERPGWAVSTHFLRAQIIAWLRSKGRRATRQAIVVTDFDVQGMWLTPHGATRSSSSNRTPCSAGIAVDGRPIGGGGPGHERGAVGLPCRGPYGP